MKCKECPEYQECVKHSNLTMKRKRCPKARVEKPMTNGDRIRAMTDEELADFLAAMSACGIDCPAREYCQATNIVSCLLNTLGWLREPVKEDAEWLTEKS